MALETYNMDLKAKVKNGTRLLAKKVKDNSLALIIIAVLLLLASVPFIVREITYSLKYKIAEKPDGFLDYMPDIPRVCPSDYRCGGISRAQTKMEHHLYADLREGSKYALPETMTTDAYDVIATEAEPTNCMIKRASVGTESPMPEGQYTPWDEIESGFLSMHKKKMEKSLKA